MGKTLRVLIVEDSESDAELATRQLRQSGYHVRAERVQDAGTMRAALTHSAWDLIISDYRMPGFDASAALTLLQQTGQDIPFLVVSGTIGEEVAVALMKAGAHDYLMKDNLARLGAAVDRELRDARARQERRTALRMLRERESQLTLAIEATEMGVFDYSPITGQTWYSDLCRRHLGLAPETAPTLEGFLEGLHPGDRDRVARAVATALLPESGGHYSEQFRLKTSPDDDPRWISAWGKVFHDDAGTPFRFLGVVRDISEQKRAERDLQLQLELTACIAEQSTNCILLTGLDGAVQFANSEAERVFGFKFDELRGTYLHRILHRLHPEGRPFPENQMLRDYEDVVYHKDGTPIAVSVSCGPLDLNGTRVGLVYSFSDIRERKLAEQALRKSDARFRKLFEADIVGITILAGDRIAEANDRFLGILGYGRDEFFAVARSWRDLTPPEGIANCEQGLIAASRQEGCPPFEKEYIRKDGTRVSVLIAAVELGKSPEPELLCFVLDQTERKNLEQQFRQAQKLESIGQLAGGVAHDFNNLLTVILGYSDLLRDGMDHGHPFRESLSQIAEAASKASGLTRQLLTFSRRNLFVPRLVAVDDLVSGLEKMLRRLIGEPIEVTVSLRAAPGLIYADPGLVEQVIMNLAVNSRDAMPDGGTLFIETSRISIDNDLAAASFSISRGNYVSLTVSDDGTGMTPEVQAKLFEPFFTTKEPGKGTGLGLSTVYGIVKQTGGSVSVHSSPGLGTTFRVLFPAADGTAQVPKPEPRAAEVRVRGSETVLVVEDELGVRNYVREVLEAHGYRALDAARGEDALEIARYYGGAIHLLLTDVVLPGMSGAEVIRQFQRIRAGVPVLRMSGYPERFGAGMSEGFAILQKPFTPEALLTRIRGILDAARRAAGAGRVF